MLHTELVLDAFVEGELLVARPEPAEGALRQAVRRAQLLRLAMKGLPATQAAALVKCSTATARAVYADPEFRQAVLSKVERAFENVDGAYESKRKSLHEMLEEQAYSSFEELVAMLETGNIHPALRVKIHQDFLDRSQESQKHESHTHRIDPTQLNLAARAAREMDKVIELMPEKAT